MPRAIRSPTHPCHPGAPAKDLQSGTPSGQFLRYAENDKFYFYKNHYTTQNIIARGGEAISSPMPYSDETK
jgi:hypothetical protein